MIKAMLLLVLGAIFLERLADFIKFMQGKYYFVTYKGVKRGNKNEEVWFHEVTDLTPRALLNELEEVESRAYEEGKQTIYLNFYIVYSVEISKKEYLKWSNKNPK